MAIRCNLSGILGRRRMKMIELAEKAGVAYGTVFSLYHERAKGVTFEVMDKLCAALECQPGDLFERVGAPEERAKNVREADGPQYSQTAVTTRGVTRLHQRKSAPDLHAQ